MLWVVVSEGAYKRAIDDPTIHYNTPDAVTIDEDASMEGETEEIEEAKEDKEENGENE